MDGVILQGTLHGSYTCICERRPRIMAEDVAGEGAAQQPPDTLAALLTAALSTKLADAISELVGTAYAAQILRVEPKTHGGAEILVAFVPLPPDNTLKIALGEEMVEIPLPPGVVDEPTA
jgi:hypothetical protein